MEVLNYIQTQRNFYENNTIPLMDGVEFSQSELISQIDHYWMDLYFDGVNASDDIIGDYPFDNISKFRVLLEARATDFDIKHIEIEPKNGSRKSRVSAMIATKALQEHLQKIQFAKFLNDFCYTRAKYGGVLTTKANEKLVVIPWQNVITDQSDIMGGIRIIRHYLTPSELSKKRGVWDNVTEAMMTADEFREKGMERGGQDDAEVQGNVIEVWEVQGDVPKSMLNEAIATKDGTDYDWKEEDDYEYVPMKLFICGIDWKEPILDEKTGKTIGEKSRAIVLYAKEEESDHRFLARNPLAGRGLGEGVVESLFEHQKWHNYTKTEEMRMLAIANKKLYITNDPDILSNIFDEGVDHGTVLRIGDNKTFTELNQLPTGVPVFQNLRQELDESASRTTSSFSAKLGEEAKSGTPFRSQYLQNVEASSQFEQYREEIGEHLKDIIKTQVLPDALKNASKKGELFTTFTPQELRLIDEVIVESRLLDEVVQKTLSRQVMQPEEVDAMRQQIQTKLQREGNKRTITDIKEFIKDAGDNIHIHLTDEARNKAVMFESMANILQLLAPEDPRRNAVIDKIMDALGLSKDELNMYAEQGASNPNPKLQMKELQASRQVGADLRQVNV